MAGKNSKASETQIRLARADLIRDVRQNYSIDRALEGVAGVRLIGAGNARIACCPFHEDRNPSLSVDIAKGVYKCHSAGCGAQGDVFTLLRSVFHMNFNEALLFGADQSGTPVPECLTEGAHKSPGKPKKRKVILYPSDVARRAPRGLAPAHFDPLPASAQLPKPGKRITAWDPSRPDGQQVTHYKPEMVHVYRNRDGHALLVILRCPKKATDGAKPGKFFIPLRPARDGDLDRSCAIPGVETDYRWIVGGMADLERRPLYGLQGLPPGTPLRTIVMVEGEKTADAASRLLADAGMAAATLSPMGGGASPLRSDWTPLLDLFSEDDPVEFLVWPDADKLMQRPDGKTVDRQEKFVTSALTGLYQALADAGISPAAVRPARITPPADMESGWDLADAEAEGWDGARLKAHVVNNSLSVDPADLPVTWQADDAQGVDPAEQEVDELESIIMEIESLTQGSEGADGSQDALTSQGDAPRSVLDLPTEDVDGVEDGIPGLIGDDDGDISEGTVFALNNPHFRCLGYNDGVDYFYSMESGFVYGLTPQMLKSSFLLKLARKEWWLHHFQKVSDRGGAVSVDWESASDALVRASYAVGYWDPSRVVGQGASIDGGKVVFNTGTILHVDGLGQVPIRDYSGDNCYLIGAPVATPAFHNPFTADDPSVHKLLDIISSLNWMPERRELSIMGLFGWMCVGPIGGILSWRPHLWLDGPRSAGKTWVINKIIAAALGDYCVYAKANSTESGIRNRMHARSLPLIFDEAEGETSKDRERIDGIIKLARHSASEGKAVVLQGQSGGGGDREFSIRSSFLLSSITPQLEASADKTRFGRAHLNEGRDLEAFIRHIEAPALELITPEFSQRFIARMILRAPDFNATYVQMIKAMTHFGIERRIMDVYGTFAAGAWLMFKDGVPQNEFEAGGFIGDTFNIVVQIQQFGDEISDEKDHTRLFRMIQSAMVRVESPNMGQRMESIGALMASASGWGDGECILGQGDAMIILKGYGIRPARMGAANADGETEFTLTQEGDRDPADCVVIHRNTDAIRAILKETGYARNYSQVMFQSSSVAAGKVTRFSSAVGVGRTVIVPLSIFSLGEGQDG